MKLEKSFSSVFRLIGVYEDETAFILPLQTTTPTDARMLSVSTREQLVFVGAANNDVVRQSPSFATVERRCSELVRAYMSSIHVLVAAPDMDVLARGNQLLRDTQNIRYDESAVEDDEEMFEEIDDIYRYVRQGGEPPAPRSRQTASADTLTDTGRQLPVPATHVGDEQNDADYNWEEPIYEDIEKIRQRKRQRATAMETTETTTMTTTMATTTTAVDNQVQQASAGADVMPVGNLRQLIKRFSMLESSTSSKPKPKPVRLDRAPPVPPKLTVHVDVTSPPPPPPPPSQTDAEQCQQVNVTASQSVVTEYVTDSVSLDVLDDVQPDTSPLPAEHAVATPSPVVCHTTYEDLLPAASCVTSVRVKGDATPRRQTLQGVTGTAEVPPYYCSRVSVGSSSSVQPVAVNPQTTVTRITTLSRQSARNRNVHQPMA